MDSSNSMGKLNVLENDVFECSVSKIACLYKGISVQLFMVLIANLDGRLLTLFSPQLGSIVARLTC